MTALLDTPWGVFAGTGDSGMFRYDPGPGQWEPLGLDHAVVSAMLFVPGPVPRLLVAMRPHAEEQTTAAVFATEDAAQTWVPWDGGLAERHGNRQWAFSLARDPGEPKRLYMGQSASVLRSGDGGRTWQYVYGSADLFGRGVNAIVISPNRDGRVWTGAEAALGNALVLRSEDWGDSWEPIIPTLGSENAVFALAVDADRPARLWAGVRGGVSRSGDGGRSWEYVLEVDGLVMSLLSGAGCLYAIGGTFSDAGSDLAVYRSGDSGTTWSMIPTPAGVPGSDVAVQDSSGRLLVGIVSPSGGVWRFVP